MSRKRVTMDEKRKRELIRLANRYEAADFADGDPSCFLRKCACPKDAEIVAFLAACLAFGRRDQIISHIDAVLTDMGDQPAQWVLSDAYTRFFPNSSAKFYRFYSFADLRCFFDRVKDLLLRYGGIGALCEARWRFGEDPRDVLVRAFAGCRLVPSDTHSACKRLCLFLRWMTRTGSPVDLGLWTWYDRRRLLIPLDTHVLASAVSLGLVTKATASLKTAEAVTAALREVWPDDPCKGDFALFGYGINGKTPSEVQRRNRPAGKTKSLSR